MGIIVLQYFQDIVVFEYLYKLISLSYFKSLNFLSAHGNILLEQLL